MTYDFDTDRVTYDLDTKLDTTTHKIIGVVGAPSTSLLLIYRPSEISSSTVVKNVFTLTVRVLTQTAEFFLETIGSIQPLILSFAPPSSTLAGGGRYTHALTDFFVSNSMPKNFYFKLFLRQCVFSVAFSPKVNVFFRFCTISYLNHIIFRAP